MSEQPYAHGQIVNGHMFDAAANQWVPLGASPVATDAPPPKKSNKLKWILGGVAALMLVGIGSAIGSGGEKPAASPSSAESTAPSTSSEATVTEPPVETATPTDVAVVETPTPVAETTKAETVSQANAVEKAASYLGFAAFSRSGLVKQLQFEGFSKADATYGVDAQNADWNEQAAAKAASYLELSAFSRSGLISQLKFEGFTTAQATYGAKAAGL